MLLAGDELRLLLRTTTAVRTDFAGLGDSILAVINLDAMSYDSNNDGKCAIQEL